MESLPIKAKFDAYCLLAIFACILIGLLSISVSTFSTPMFAFLETAFEHRFPRTVLRGNDRLAGLVVLGGNISRIREAANLATKYPTAKVVLSGPSYSEIYFVKSDSALAKKVVIDVRPKSTFENAIFSIASADAQQGERWLLLTSSLHMPRAISTFRTMGFNVEPWPVADRTSPQEREPVILHELGALIVYRILGRTDAFWPGP